MNAHDTKTQTRISVDKDASLPKSDDQVDL